MSDRPWPSEFDPIHPGSDDPATFCPEHGPLSFHRDPECELGRLVLPYDDNPEVKP